MESRLLVLFYEFFRYSACSYLSNTAFDRMNVDQRPAREFDETYGLRVKEKEVRQILDDHVDGRRSPCDTNPVEDRLCGAQLHCETSARPYVSDDMESLTLSNCSREPRIRPVRTVQQVYPQLAEFMNCIIHGGLLALIYFRCSESRSKHRGNRRYEFSVYRF